MELNREQIIKALECCLDGTDCTMCPLVDEKSCPCVLNENALALINELTEESQKWQEAYDCADSACRGLSSKCDQLTEENESLDAEKGHLELVVEEKLKRTSALEKQVLSLTETNEGLHASCTNLTQVCKKWQNRVKIECEYTRADTVRKMQSEIKERCIKGGIYPAFVARTIYQIAKEMLEGGTDD